MSEEPTTAAVQRYLNALAEDSPAESIVRMLMERAANRLRLLCASVLHRSYPRLTQPSLNLQRTSCSGAWWPGSLLPCGRSDPKPRVNSSLWQPNTCVGSSMTWPAA